MKINPDESESAVNLRQRAEQFLQQEPAATPTLAAEEIQRLVHELQVHQIELEMQNEELRQAQELLAESRDQYVDLYDFAPISYFTISDKGLILAANLASATFLGVDRSSLLQQPFTRFIAKADLGRFYTHLLQSLATQSPQICELKMVKTDGALYDVQVQSIAWQAGNSPSTALRTTVVDISERKRMEEALRTSNEQLKNTLAELKKTQDQLVQQERLAAVGQLATGVAHNFNNLLTPILLFAELMHNAPAMPESVQPRLMHIINAAQRGATLARQILDFSRKSIHRSEPVDMATLVEETTQLLRLTFPENIRISVKREPGTYLLTGDPEQLEQVVMNLAINARDAMPAGGALDLQLSHLHLQPWEPLPAASPTLSPGQWMVIAVADSGTGISAEVLPRIFEPFFTTKEVGKGTGLGLAQVYGIVRQHSGSIGVSTQPGQGTTFTIYLPILQAKEAPVNTVSPSEIPLGAGETILLVEDQPLVLAATKEVLNELNYHVLAASNGAEALALYLRHRREVALVLSDMVMPEMDGATLFQQLKALDPIIKMVIMTGYPLGTEMASFVSAGMVDWLQKPVNIEQIAQSVHRVLHLS